MHGKHRRKERETGRAEKKRLWHSFPCRQRSDLLDYRFAVWQFWHGAAARLISKTEPNALSPPRRSLIEFKAQGWEGREISGIWTRGRHFSVVRNIRGVLPRSLFLSFSLALSLFCLHTVVTYRASSVFLFHLFPGLAVVTSLFLFISSLSLRYFSRLSFARSFPYLVSRQLSP